MLVMFAVGLWSAATTMRIWLVPISFMAMLLTGALLAQSELTLPAVEAIVAASVLPTGQLICQAIPKRRLEAIKVWIFNADMSVQPRFLG